MEEFIGKHVTLTKISDEKFMGHHPNGINVGYQLKGWFKKIPVVGEQFYLYYGMKLDAACSWTSKVEEINGVMIRTENSLYKVEVSNTYKNIEIAKMMNEPLDLDFLGDAELQFKAIEWIEDLDHSEHHYQWKGIDGEMECNFECYEVDSHRRTCFIEMHLSLDPQETVAIGTGMNRKEAIFNALYEFSEYLKEKDYGNSERSNSSTTENGES